MVGGSTGKQRKEDENVVIGIGLGFRAPPGARYGTETLSASDQALLSETLSCPSPERIKNRLCKAALSENMVRPDGQVDKSHLDLLVNAEGGSGLILTGNVMVDRTMREMELNVAVEDERNFDPPRALTIKETQDLVRAFVNTSVILHKAGFDGIELHGAHGYLNPNTNERTDEPCSIPVQGIKAATPKEFSIGVKLNSVDFGRRRQESNDNGKSEANGAQDRTAANEVDQHLEEAVQVSLMLEQLGVDFIEVSG
ncbi:hypothetical protein BGZ65_010995, partial [Modicella reniformis]